MNLNEAQGKIKSRLMANPESIIEKVRALDLASAEEINEVCAAPGSPAGAAAAILQLALRGKDNADSAARLISFAEKL